MRMLIIVASVAMLGVTLGQVDESIVCVDKMCLINCEFGFKKDIQGCDMCECQVKECSGKNCALGKVCKVIDSVGQCVDPRVPERCQQPSEVGRCRGAMARWYYDVTTGGCKAFTFGGCGGNNNNFKSLADCQKACTPAPAAEAGCGEVTCAMECPLGFKRDQYGCPLCQCAESSISVECEKPLCVQYCPAGFKRDEFGCEICECNSPGERCLPIMCDMECFHGFKKDAQGCDTCECLQPAPLPQQVVPACQPVRCRMYCENGYKKDANGCDMCECASQTSNPVASNPQVACSPVRCRMYCANGYKKDANGCDTCQCNEKSPSVQIACPAVMCMMYCQNGFKKDANGCDVCQCNDRPATSAKPIVCSSIGCLLHCENGFKKDAQGCDMCECLQPSPRPQVPACQPVRCRMYCENGYKKDANGCDMCQCNEKSPSVQIACPAVMCMMYCDNGFKKDANGCDVCECAAPKACEPVRCNLYCANGFKKNAATGCETCVCEVMPDAKGKKQVDCPAVMCAMYCENGFKKDVNGCDMCQCASQAEPLCPQCLMHCPYGFLKRQDNSGCPLCECAENPCNVVDCATGHRCKAVVRGDVYEPMCMPSTDCPDVQCLMHCEHGFAVDQRGCEMCQCLPSVAPSQCAKYKCKPCAFGYSRDLYGCMTCVCLPNPCQNMQCSRGQVCVVDRVPDCFVCALSGHCSDPRHANSASVNITLLFNSEVANPLELERLESQLHDQLSKHLKSHNDHLKNFQIQVDDKSKVEVTFYVTKNDFGNLPARINEVRESFEDNWDQLSIASVDDTVSSVVTGHFDAVYFSDESVPDGGQHDKKSKPRVTLIVVCAVVILSVLLTLAIVLLVHKRKKTGYNEPKGVSSVSTASYQKIKVSPNLVHMT